MSDLILIRGLPGSGKSTLAKAMVGYVHLEADMYFTYENDVYLYDPAFLKQAHEWCQEETADRLRANRSVVVSNTFTTWKEMDPYLTICKMLGKNWSIIIARGNFPNIHNVPQDVLDRMKARWED